MAMRSSAENPIVRPIRMSPRRHRPRFALTRKKNLRSSAEVRYSAANRVAAFAHSGEGTMADQQSKTNHYSYACCVLHLADAMMGFLRTVEGGEPIGNVVNEPVDPNGVVKKHIDGVTYQPIVMTFGAGMGDALYQWMADTLARKPSAKSGALIF